MVDGEGAPTGRFSLIRLPAARAASPPMRGDTPSKRSFGTRPAERMLYRIGGSAEGASTDAGYRQTISEVLREVR